MALLNAMLLLSVFTIMIVTGISFTQTSLRATRHVKDETQAYNVARAGLVDAINWFKRQANQPVTKFKPAYNTAVPAKGDTNDPYLIDPGAPGGKLDPSDSGGGPNDKPSLGIVQEFPIDEANGLWGRYEVGKLTALTADSKGKLTVYSVVEYDSASGTWVKKTVGQATSTQWEGVRDVTKNYGLNGGGLIWRIRSHGYVYRKNPDAPAGSWFFQNGNEVLSQVVLETEIRRLQVQDYLCALHANGVTNLYTNTSTSITFNGDTRVKLIAPDGYAMCYRGGTVSPATPPSSFVSGQVPAFKVQAGDSLSWNEMFGVSDGSVLASMADSYVTDLSQLPESMSSMALTYIKPVGGTATFNATRPLNGGGILVVDGNLVIDYGSASAFSGVVYVTGNFTQNSPSAMTGQVVVNGSSTVNSPSDVASIEYNPALLNEVRRQLGQYRERRSGLRISQDY